jgi:acyl carrier protein
VEFERNALIETLKEMVIEECDKEIETSQIDDDELLIGGPLDLDSLDALQICMAVKNNYGVRIEGGPQARAALQSITTLADTVIRETKAIKETKA